MLELKEAIGPTAGSLPQWWRSRRRVVFTVERPISQARVEAIHHHWRRVTEGTSLEGVKCLLLQGGMTMQIVDDVGDADA